MKETKVQWHPGFVASVDLELMENRKGLVFSKEYNLNTKPMEIDLLVVKKSPDIRIENEIGRIFRGHNIMEYKSPEDRLDIDRFYKAEAYASLYKSYGETVDCIKAGDVSITIVRDSKPVKLFRCFTEHGYTVWRPYPGIYYIEGKVLFPTQLIVTRELEGRKHIWLRALSENMKKQDMKELWDNIRRLKGKYDKELADSVLEVSIQANEEIVEELKGDGSMGQALMKLMEPQVRMMEKEAMERGMKKGMKKGMERGMKEGIEKGMKRGMEKGMEKGKAEGIRGTVEVLQDLGHGDDEIEMLIKKKYGLTDEEAKGYLE